MPQRVQIKPTCWNCKTRFCNRPKGLCWRCYYRTDAQSRYVSTSKFAFRGVGNGMAGGLKACVPTSVPPGPEKVAVLMERAKAGEALWHPLDAS